jgi:hypothetical protein
MESQPLNLRYVAAHPVIVSSRRNPSGLLEIDVTGLGLAPGSAEVVFGIAGDAVALDPDSAVQSTETSGLYRVTVAIPNGEPAFYQIKVGEFTSTPAPVP